MNRKMRIDLKNKLKASFHTEGRRSALETVYWPMVSMVLTMAAQSAKPLQEDICDGKGQVVDH